jgi:hypothetical protein
MENTETEFKIILRGIAYFIYLLVLFFLMWLSLFL